LCLEVYTLAWHKTTHVAALGPHRVVLSEFGAGTAISQTFTMPSDGFRALRLLLSAPDRTDVAFAWSISEERNPNAFDLVAHGRATPRVTGNTWETIAFAPIVRSATKTYRLDVQRVDVPPGADGSGRSRAAVGLAAALDHVPHEWLKVGDRDRWGELVFETEAAGDTILGRFMLLTVPSLPAPLRHPVTLWGLFGLYNLTLAAFVIAYWPDFRRHESTSVNTATRTRHVGAVVVSLGLIAALAAASRERRPRSIDLVDEMHGADLQSSPMTMRAAFEIMPEGLGDNVTSIFAHSTSQIRWPIMIPERAHLRTATAVHPGAWPHGGDGVVLRIGISDDGRYQELFMRHVDPAHVATDRRWIPVDLDLSAYGGKRVELTFKTDASMPGHPLDADYDWAMWGAPRLEY